MSRSPLLRVVVIRLGALGDLVLATSVTQALARAGYQVTLVTSRRYAAVAEVAAGVARVVAFDPARHLGLGGLAALAREIGSAELVLDLQHKPRTALLSRLIPARQRRALVLRAGADGLRALLGRDRVITGRHQLQLCFEVVRDLVENSYAFTRPAPRASHEEIPRPRLELERAPGGGVVLVPGAAHAAKRWPTERYGELAERLLADGRDVEVLVGPGEESLARTIEQVAGRALPSSPGEAIDEVLRACAAAALVVGGDSGPLHVAAALGVPSLALFGPTSEQRWRPVGPGAVLTHAIECRPCTNHSLERCPLEHHRCLREITVEQVYLAARRWLVRGQG